MSAVVHVAGPYKELVQSCTRCGEELINYKNAWWSLKDGPPRGWKEGDEVVVHRADGVRFDVLRSQTKEPAALCGARR